MNRAIQGIIQGVGQWADGGQPVAVPFLPGTSHEE